MARGYCPNQECPNTDVLDDARPCPTCGREVKELSPREYWRARTIKMMHAHEIAEIAEIQEVARRTLGEASVVPKVQAAEDAPPSQEQEGPVEAGLADSAEPLTGSEEIIGGEAELVGSAWEIENVATVEELMPSEAAGAISEEESAELEAEETSGGAEATAVEPEPISKDFGEPEDSSEEPEDRSQESEALEQAGSETSDKETEPSDASHEVLTSESMREGVELESESAPSESEATANEGGRVLEDILEVEDVSFVEGLLSVAADFQAPEEESAESERGYEEVPSGEVSEAKEIAELEGGGELPGEAADAESSEWKRSELLRKESAEEVSAPMEILVEGGMEKPASPVRIITFREGGTEIGICPFCGRFVRGSDLARHKLKHRVRNVFGFQAGD